MEALEKSIDGEVRFDDFAYHSRKYMGAAELPPLKKDSISEAVRRLRLGGIVERSINNEGKIIIKLLV